jgi:DNA polymerase III subunit gamma/tau
LGQTEDDEPMSHQVLARKWRPGRFEDLIGQPHVVRALVNALNNDRLHHAYLFSGTRGVGKTTVARILARCLNCETGVTATPCGQCRCCLEIAAGRHLDLIEVDAASRTRVDDTRELLDNVSYAPVSGRFKVYLIDEVHMLSEKSFNALLKTLEEPPPHVKFLLATTDPQKLPVTVLSRCLQFNLKPMSTALIAEHLERILAAEGIAAEPGALLRLGEAAEGSMRDALSLTDQAIAYGGGGLTESDICDMIGLLPRSRLSELLDASWAGQGARLLEILRELDALAPDWSRLLEELAALVHGIAVEQAMAEDSAAPPATPVQDPLVTWQREAARRHAPEEIQLAYQILLHGRRDLPYAPDPRIGVEMTLLRMLAFRPDPAPREQMDTTVGATAGARTRPAAPSARVPAAVQASPPVPPLTPRSDLVREPRPPRAPEPEPAVGTVLAPVPSSAPPQGVAAPRPVDWHAFARGLPPGPVRELALHADLLEHDAERVVIAMQPAHQTLCTERSRARLSEALAKVLGGPVRLDVRDRAVPSSTTPAARLAADAAERQARIESEARADPVIAALRETFGAEVARVHVRNEADATGEGGVPAA